MSQVLCIRFGGSVIIWPPGSGSGSRSEPVGGPQLSKIQINFRRSSIFFNISRYYCTRDLTTYFVQRPQKCSGMIDQDPGNLFASRIRIRNSGLRIPGPGYKRNIYGSTTLAYRLHHFLSFLH